MKLLSGVLFMGLACSGVALAADEDRFARMDTNNDGKVVWEEFEVAMPQMRKPAFETLDADKSGFIDRAEWESFRKDHGQSGMTGKPGMQTMPAEKPAGTPSSALPVIQPPKAKN